MNAIKAEEPSCRISHSVSLYADGELEPNRAIEVEMHLAVCTSCHEELELIRAMRRSLRRSTSRKLPTGFEERMLRVATEAADKSIAQAFVSPAGFSADTEMSVHSSAVHSSPVHSSPVQASPLEASPVEKADLVAKTGADKTGSEKAATAREASSHITGERARTRRRFGRIRMSWGTAMAMAAAASFVVAFFATRTQRADSVARLPTLKASSLINPISVASADIDKNRGTFDQLIDQLVNLHANPIPPETKNFDEAVDRFNGTLGVGLDRRMLRRPFGANFSGARMHVIEFREPDFQPTAELRYTMQGHRITIYVFDPRRVPMRVTHLTQRVVRSSPVYVGRVRGFSVAAAENAGVGYAMASDLDDDRSAQLVSEIR